MPSVRVALQLSGHLRDLCESPAHFAPLESTVFACRNAVARCDLFVHTWDTLHAQTSSWHTWHPTDIPSATMSSSTCVAKLKSRLQPVKVEVDHQLPGASANETWVVAAGKRRETHVSLAGIRSAIYGVSRVAAMRREYELARKDPPYDVAIRLRPDIYHRRNPYRGNFSAPRGELINQVCAVSSRPDDRAWETIAAASATAPCGSCVRGCGCGLEYDGAMPTGLFHDMCFWSSPPDALDRLVAAWEALADGYLQANVCWQRWRRQRVQMAVAVRGRRPSQLASAPNDSTMMPSCRHPETQEERKGAELILAAAARNQSVRHLPLYGTAAAPECGCTWANRAHCNLRRNDHSRCWRLCCERWRRFASARAQLR